MATETFCGASRTSYLCAPPTGHEGDHEWTRNGQRARWRNSDEAYERGLDIRSTCEVRQNVFSDEECRVLAGVVGTTAWVVDALGRLAWRKQQGGTG